jgi:hypothetical protein
MHALALLQWCCCAQIVGVAEAPQTSLSVDCNALHIHWKFGASEVVKAHTCSEERGNRTTAAPAGLSDVMLCVSRAVDPDSWSRLVFVVASIGGHRTL